VFLSGRGDVSIQTALLAVLELGLAAEARIRTEIFSGNAPVLAQDSSSIGLRCSASGAWLLTPIATMIWCSASRPIA
jgi:hypothetical protein